MNSDDGFQHQLQTVDKNRPLTVAGDYINGNDKGRELALERLSAPDPKARRESHTRCVGRIYSPERRHVFYTDTKEAPWIVVKPNDKLRARMESMRHVRNLLLYPGKDTSLVCPPESRVCGPASVLSEYGGRLWR